MKSRRYTGQLTFRGPLRRACRRRIGTACLVLLLVIARLLAGPASALPLTYDRGDSSLPKRLVVTSFRSEVVSFKSVRTGKPKALAAVHRASRFEWLPLYSSNFFWGVETATYLPLAASAPQIKGGIRFNPAPRSPPLG